ncbi:chloride channel protein [Propionicimonas paludicola]|nr:chloride channel protein [Propionicimonas paludicola]
MSWRTLLATFRRRTQTWPMPVRVAVGVIATGLSVGVAATLVTELLHLIQHLAYGYTDETFLLGVEHADPLRRVLAPTLGLGLAGLAWMWLRRRRLPQVSEACGPKARRLPLGRTTADALLQILAVGTGASIGRERAPRQIGAALASVLSSVLGIGRDTRRRLVIAGAGAGLAVVYNVPLSGVIFGAEVLAGGFGLSGLAIFVPVSLVAVAVSWPVLGMNSVYQLPAGDLDATTLIWALAAAPLCALVGAGFDRLVRWCGRWRPQPTWRLPVATALAGLAVGVAAIWWPSLPGNGKGIVQLGLAGGATALTFALLLVLKPVATAVTAGSGVDGGFLTPALGTGAALGAAVAMAGLSAGQNWPVATFTLIAAVGVLAATQRAPWFAAVFGWELARPSIAMLGVLVVVAWGTALIARRLPWTAQAAPKAEPKQ